MRFSATIFPATSCSPLTPRKSKHSTLASDIVLIFVPVALCYLLMGFLHQRYADLGTGFAPLNFRFCPINRQSRSSSAVRSHYVFSSSLFHHFQAISSEVYFEGLSTLSSYFLGLNTRRFAFAGFLCYCA